MIQDKIIQQVECDELKDAELLLIYQFSRLNWEIFDFDSPNEKEVS